MKENHKGSAAIQSSVETDQTSCYIYKRINHNYHYRPENLDFHQTFFISQLQGLNPLLISIHIFF